MNHESMIELILQFEELRDEERQQATTHLGECPACRTMLAQLQKAEHEALGPADIAPLPADPDGDPAGGLVGEDLRQAQASRTLLLAKVRADRRRRRVTPLGWGGMALALAACLVLAFGLPGSGETSALVQDISLTPARLLRGDPAAALQPGDAFVVRFSLTEDGWPVVVSREPDGAIAVLYPQTAGDGPLPAGTPVVLPHVGSPVTWRVKDLDAEVWIALARDGAPDLDALRHELAGAPTAAAVGSRLTRRFGSAAVAEVGFSRP